LPSEASGAPQDEIVTAIKEALDTVVDPCSRMNGTWMSLMELGMIDSVATRNAGGVLIKLLLDDPTCAYLYEIQRAVRTAALSVPDVSHVEIEVVYDRIWTEDLLSARGREKLRASRARPPSPLLQIAPYSPSAE
jgi:metal-sulfur cluster biosynthetic enzyme